MSVRRIIRFATRTRLRSLSRSTAPAGELAFQTVAPDTTEALRDAMDRAFESDLVVLSGGVSAGKYDLVESVLAEFDAEFFFTRVRIQPGQPAVFGRARRKFFFGLPGNPASTMVTFELFARLAIELLAGDRNPRLPFSRSRLTSNFRHKPGLTRFLPALIDRARRSCDTGNVAGFRRCLRPGAG